MITNDITRESIINELQTVLDENLYAIMNDVNIAKIRENIYSSIMKAKTHNIDISDVFPVCLQTTNKNAYIYQNGDTYICNNDSAIMIKLYNNYGEYMI